MHISPTCPVNHTRPRQFHWRGGAAARFLVGLALAGAAGAASAATYTDAGSTSIFSTAFNPAIPGGGTTTADILIFSNTTTSSQTDDLTQALLANILTFSNTAALTLNQGAGTTISLGGTTPVVNLNNTALVTDNLNLSLAANTTFNGNGSLTLGGVLSGAGFTLTKNGTGTLTLAGNGASTLGSSSTGGTILNLASGTTTFGVAGTDAPTLSIAGNNTGVFLTGGNFNMVNGTITDTDSQGLVISGSQTYAQTGGTFTNTGRIEFANNGGSSTVNVSAGTLSTTASTGIETVRGTTTINLSGTGAITTPLLNMTTAQLSGGAASSTFNLNGGTLTTGQIIPGTNGATGTGTIFNFNGGTLKASAGSATFLQGLTNAFVKSGGAVIDTVANNDTIGQSLLDGTGGGGLTKLGTGTLTLAGANTYTGASQIAAGTLAINSDGSLGAVPASAVSNIQFTGTGTLQDAANNVTLNANRSISIANGVTATLDSGANVFGVGGAVSTGSGAAATTLALTGTSTGANTLSGTVSDTGSTGGLIISKSGAGTWTYGGNGTSTLAKGNIFVTGGTLNFGVTGADSPTLALAFPNQTAFNVTGAGSIFNMANGSLTLTDTTYGLLFSGNGGQAFNQTGGSISTNGLIGFSDSGGTTTVNVSGGSLTTTRSFDANGLTLATRGVTTFNLSGTGAVTTPTLNMSTNQVGSGAATGTFNLNGGTLTTNTVIKGTGGSTGTQTFNFNGGTLKASTAGSATFLQGLTAANVRNGGAVINTNGFNDTIGQSLVHSTIGGDNAIDGGLTKRSAGTLTLAGTTANTYTGVTTVSAGTLALGKTAGVNAVAGNAVVSGNSSGVTASSVNGVLTLVNADQIADTAGVTLSGGAFSTGGKSETANTLSQTVASFIDFGSGASILNFTGSVGTTFTSTLSLLGWSGTSAGGGLDQFYLGTGQNLSTSQLAQILFINPDGFAAGTYGAQQLTSGEVVVAIAAAPEPSQWAALLVGALGLGGLSLKARRRAA